MNRWSKYGGIMPELYNTAVITRQSNVSLTEQGTTTSGNGFYTANYFPVNRGKYKISFIANDAQTLTTRRLRIHAYNQEKTSLGQLIVDNIAPFEVNDIFSYYINVSQDGFLRFSVDSRVTVLEIEKL